MGAEILLFGALALLASNIQSGKVRLFGGMDESIKTIPRLEIQRKLPPPPTDAGDMVGTGQDLINRGGVVGGAVRP